LPPRGRGGRVRLGHDEDEAAERSAGAVVLTERARAGLADAAALTRASGLLGPVDEDLDETEPEPEPGREAAPGRTCWVLAPQLDARLRDAKDAAAKAARLHARATNIRREAVAVLQKAGLGDGEVAAVLGVAEHRVAQLSGAKDTCREATSS
jgi:hypothetical protein